MTLGSKGLRFVIELVVIVGLAIGLALLIRTFLVKPYKIPTPSMVPTLVPGQRVLVDRIGGRFGTPKVGQIAVFHPPRGWELQTAIDANVQVFNPRCGESRMDWHPCSKPLGKRSNATFIKRIVGGPGDRIRMVDGHIVRNGKQAHEPFAQPCRNPVACNFPREITIPPGHYFFAGDNRGESDDSRFWGPVPREWIIGEAVATIWPPKRIGLF